MNKFNFVNVIMEQEPKNVLESTDSKHGNIQMSDWFEHFGKLSFSNHVNDFTKYWCKVHLYIV